MAYRDARPPKEVHQAFLTLVAYLGVGLLSSIIAIVYVSIALSNLSSSLGGVGFRVSISGVSVGASIIGLVFTVLIYAVALFVMIQMRAGRDWARITMTVLAGIGLLLGVIGLIVTLTDFSIAGQIYGGGYVVIFALIGLIQVGLLSAAIYLMFRPANNGYFR